MNVRIFPAVLFSACMLLLVSRLEAQTADNLHWKSKSQSLAATHTSGPGIINTFAGNGYQGFLGVGGPALAAELFSPISSAVDKDGNLYLADDVGEYIYKVDAVTGKLSIFAGTGAGGYSGDEGPATQATFNHPFGLAFGPAGNLFISDSNNNVIRKIDTKTGIIHTVAGNGYGAGPGDADNCGVTVSGANAKQTPICNPFGIAVDGDGNFYFTSGSQVDRVQASTGILTIVAGSGAYGYSGDEGPAIDATLSWLPGLALDSQRNIYISDSGNCAIRVVDAVSGVISSLVGSPQSPYSGACGLAGDGGPAGSALIRSPFGIAVDKDSDVFIADEGNNLVRMVSAGNGNIYTVAGSYANGTGNYGYSGDGGPAVDATLAEPMGVTVDAAGTLYISDNENFVIRTVPKAAATAQSASVRTIGSGKSAAHP